MEPHRKHWNEQQQQLQKALQRPKDHPLIVDLFIRQHASLHGSALTGVSTGPDFWSFDDELWQGLDEATARIIPPKGEHSIVWMIWHLARCEDLTMNMLAAGAPQVLTSGGWLEKLNTPICDTGNALDAAGIAAFSEAVDIDALRGYRLAVGKQTQEIVRGLPLEAFKQSVDPARIQQVKVEGGVVDEAQWLLDYWAGRTIAGLLLMPPTRHNFVHLNEAMQIKQKFSK